MLFPQFLFNSSSDGCRVSLSPFLVLRRSKFLTMTMTTIEPNVDCKCQRIAGSGTIFFISAIRQCCVSPRHTQTHRLLHHYVGEALLIPGRRKVGLPRTSIILTVDRPPSITGHTSKKSLSYFVPIKVEFISDR